MILLLHNFDQILRMSLLSSIDWNDVPGNTAHHEFCKTTQHHTEKINSWRITE